VRYTPAGGIIHVGWQQRMQGGGVFEVRDTGVGIAREHLARLGERFYRVDDGRSRSTGGTGLGLAIAKHTAQRHGGEMQVDSEPGKGSTFRIYLLENAAIEEPARTGASHPQPGITRGQGELILVAEDEEQVRRVAARALSEAGYQVLEAANGREALELAARATAPVRLVLTDVVMPEMSGRELADRLAVLLPGTPVLFTSGYTDGEILRRGLLAPESEFLGKPFSPDAVVRAVRDRLAPAKG